MASEIKKKVPSMSFMKRCFFCEINRFDVEPGSIVHWFRYPKEDETRLIWAAALMDLDPDFANVWASKEKSKSLYICSLHFDEDAYTHRGQGEKMRSYMNKDAIPTIMGPRIFMNGVRQRLIGPSDSCRCSSENRGQKPLPEKFRRIYQDGEYNMPESDDEEAETAAATDKLGQLVKEVLIPDIEIKQEPIDEMEQEIAQHQMEIEQSEALFALEAAALSEMTKKTPVKRKSLESPTGTAKKANLSTPEVTETTEQSSKVSKPASGTSKAIPKKSKEPVERMTKTKLDLKYNMAKKPKLFNTSSKSRQTLPNPLGRQEKVQFEVESNVSNPEAYDPVRKTVSHKIYLTEDCKTCYISQDSSSDPITPSQLKTAQIVAVQSARKMGCFLVAPPKMLLLKNMNGEPVNRKQIPMLKNTKVFKLMFMLEDTAEESIELPGLNRIGQEEPSTPLPKEKDAPNLESDRLQGDGSGLSKDKDVPVPTEKNNEKETSEPDPLGEMTDPLEETPDPLAEPPDQSESEMSDTRKFCGKIEEVDCDDPNSDPPVIKYASARSVVKDSSASEVTDSSAAIETNETSVAPEARETSVDSEANVASAASDIIDVSSNTEANGGSPLKDVPAVTETNNASAATDFIDVSSDTEENGASQPMDVAAVTKTSNASAATPAPLSSCNETESQPAPPNDTQVSGSASSSEKTPAETQLASSSQKPATQMTGVYEINFSSPYTSKTSPKLDTTKKLKLPPKNMPIILKPGTLKGAPFKKATRVVMTKSQILAVKSTLRKGGPFHKPAPPAPLSTSSPDTPTSPLSKAISTIASTSLTTNLKDSMKEKMYKITTPGPSGTSTPNTKNVAYLVVKPTADGKTAAVLLKTGAKKPDISFESSGATLCPITGIVSSVSSLTTPPVVSLGVKPKTYSKPASARTPKKAFTPVIPTSTSSATTPSQVPVGAQARSGATPAHPSTQLSRTQQPAPAIINTFKEFGMMRKIKVYIDQLNQPQPVLPSKNELISLLPTDIAEIVETVWCRAMNTGTENVLPGMELNAFTTNALVDSVKLLNVFGLHKKSELEDKMRNKIMELSKYVRQRREHDGMMRQKVRALERQVEKLKGIRTDITKKLKAAKGRAKRAQTDKDKLKEQLKTLSDPKKVVTEELEDKLSPVAMLMIKRLLDRHGDRQQYCDEIKRFCLRTYRASPMAYEYMQRIFKTCLPSRKTVCKWMKESLANKEPVESIIDQVALGNFVSRHLAAEDDDDDDIQFLETVTRSSTDLASADKLIYNLVEAPAGAPIEGLEEAPAEETLEEEVVHEEVVTGVDEASGPKVQIQWTYPTDPKVQYAFEEQDMSILIDVVQGQEYQIHNSE